LPILKVLPVTLSRSSEAAICTNTFAGYFKTICGYETSYRKPPRTCTIFVHFRGFFLHPMRGGDWRKSTNNRDESQYRNYDAGYETILELVQTSVSKESSRHYVYICLLNEAA
jgi:hypothetical protein